MTRNEQIAKIMGWTCSEKYKGVYLSQVFSPALLVYDIYDWECCKALQARMVEDGWHIKINQSIREEPQFWCDAISENCNGTYDYRSIADTEPAAIVELFCKVYGIK